MTTSPCVSSEALDPQEQEAAIKAETEPTLKVLVERWLERTPGLESDGFDFWSKFSSNVNGDLQKKEDAAQVCV
jgi:tryptophan 2,3-dioxygenase